MRTEPRIRPRAWLQVGESGWGPRWRPISLLFRRRQKPADPTPAPHLRPVFQSNSISYFSRHTRHNVREGHRFPQWNYFVVERPRVHASLERSAAPSVPAPTHRVDVVNRLERRIENYLHVATTRHTERILAASGQTLHVFRDTASAPAASSPQRLGLPDPPPAGFSTGNRMKRPRAVDSEVAGLARKFDPPAGVRRPHKELVLEHRLATRLRTVEEPAAREPRKSVTPLRSAEQVWRRATPSLPEIQDQAARPAHKGTAAAAAAQGQAAETVRAERSAPLATAPARIEGPALDRLADDVMKRIERHLRIERERRGI